MCGRRSRLQIRSVLRQLQAPNKTRFPAQGSSDAISSKRIPTTYSRKCPDHSMCRRSNTAGEAAASSRHCAWIGHCRRPREKVYGAAQEQKKDCALRSHRDSKTIDGSKTAPAPHSLLRVGTLQGASNRLDREHKPV